MKTKTAHGIKRKLLKRCPFCFSINHRLTKTVIGPKSWTENVFVYLKNSENPHNSDQPQNFASPANDNGILKEQIG